MQLLLLFNAIEYARMNYPNGMHLLTSLRARPISSPGPISPILQYVLCVLNLLCYRCILFETAIKVGMTWCRGKASTAKGREKRMSSLSFTPFFVWVFSSHNGNDTDTYFTHTHAPSIQTNPNCMLELFYFRIYLPFTVFFHFIFFLVPRLVFYRSTYRRYNGAAIC